MMDWTYFRWVALLWGLLAILTKPVLFNVFGAQWKAWLQGSAYKAGKRPRWILPGVVLMLAFVGYTWWRVAQDGVPQAWILGLLMTGLIVKSANLIFRYDQFQVFVRETLGDPAQLRRLNWSVGGLGAVLLLLAFLVY